MNYAHIEVPLPNGYEAKLMFRQYQSGGDWICQASDELMTDLQDMLAEQPLSWGDKNHDACGN